jgi:hypothetical protein
MNAQNMFESAERLLRDGGWVLLQVTAVLVLSYLMIFAGSLLVAAGRRRVRRVGH